MRSPALPAPTIEAIIDRIHAVGVIPIIRARSGEHARRAIAALHAGGLDIVEVTLTVPEALQVIRDAVTEFAPDVLVGAGTVLTADQVRDAVSAGAQFIVSPGFAPVVLRAADAARRLAIPGVLTPTEIMAARAAGASLLKVFPCGALGGPAYLRALRAPFPDLAFIPTGSVSPSNAADYIAAGAWALGIGSELVDRSALERGEARVITDAARALITSVRDARRSAGSA
jgi:2-dehydro-3-deoxyphosphogluconate aldolase/(4S)-4-hydroxy-2-oxoglutarate aldolase